MMPDGNWVLEVGGRCFRSTGSESVHRSCPPWKCAEWIEDRRPAELFDAFRETLGPGRGGATRVADISAEHSAPVSLGFAIFAGTGPKRRMCGKAEHGNASKPVREADCPTCSPALFCIDPAHRSKEKSGRKSEAYFFDGNGNRMQARRRSTCVHCNRSST